MAHWKILDGVHCDKDAKVVSRADAPGIEHVDDVFYAGDVIETDKDLSKHNTPGSTKFAKLDESAPNDELDGMTVAQLNTFAEEETIDLPPGLKKDQLIKAIRARLAYAAAIA